MAKTMHTSTIEPFSLSVPQSNLDDLQGRMEWMRWPDAETVSDTSQGPPLREMIEMMSNGGPFISLSAPTGVSMFPGDLSRRWAEGRFSRLIHFSELDRGGHFAALEQPGLFVHEVRETFKSFR